MVWREPLASFLFLTEGFLFFLLFSTVITQGRKKPWKEFQSLVLPGTYVTKTRSVIASGGADLLNQFDSSRTAAEA